MFTDRINLTLVIGTNDDINTELSQVTETLSRIYGGLTLTEGKGFWAEDGDEFTDSYNGQVFVENAYVITLCMMPDALDMEKIQASFAPLKGKAEWIHCEKTLTQAAHFQI